MLIPPFCPNNQCLYHYLPFVGNSWYRSKGSYYSDLSGKVTRFVCRHCGKGFSEQTFRLDYYVKRKLSYRDIFHSITDGGGLRKIARRMNVSHEAIGNRLSRLARQAIAVQAELTAELQLKEDLVTDGFESFVADQYQPNNIHILVGKQSQFLYAFDYAHLRRKGRMSEAQKLERNQREDRYLHNRISVTESFSNIIHTVEQLIMNTDRPEIKLFSDEKLEYQRVIEHSPWLQDFARAGKFSHVRISSKLPRTTVNPLFAVNYYDRELRKDNANHVRETVRFSKNVNNCMERFAVYQMQHNYFKPYRVDQKEYKEVLHGEVAGLSGERIKGELQDIFQMRRFFSRVSLNFLQLKLWARMFATLDRFEGAYEPRYIWM